MISRRLRAVSAAVLIASLAGPAFPAQSPLRGADPVMQVPVIEMNVARLSSWTEVQARHLAQIGNGSPDWRRAVAALGGTPASELPRAVNRVVNQATYVSDRDNWGSADHWATPVDLFRRGGDCEDYAIAKYYLLLEMGVPASAMRVLILRPSGGIGEHAVLLVQTADGPMILDNLRSAPYRYTQRTARDIAYAFDQRSMWLSMVGLPTMAAR